MVVDLATRRVEAVAARRKDTTAAALGLGLFGLLTVLVCVRSWVPVTTYAHFDSDQAVFGLMARDLVAGRGFPIFMYGQRYMLAVSVWLCAPLFAWFGASIATLKLPPLLMNIAVVAMMWIGLRREPGIGPWGTALAILPFAMPSAVIGSRLVEHAGGTSNRSSLCSRRSSCAASQSRWASSSASVS